MSDSSYGFYLWFQLFNQNQMYPNKNKLLSNTLNIINCNNTVIKIHLVCHSHKNMSIYVYWSFIYNTARFCGKVFYLNKIIRLGAWSTLSVRQVNWIRWVMKSSYARLFFPMKSRCLPPSMRLSPSLFSTVSAFLSAYLLKRHIVKGSTIEAERSPWLFREE